MSNDVYLGNPLLKKANTPIEFTQEQILEFVKCKDDPVYFANNYVKIVTLDYGLQTFKPYHFQEKFINNFHNHRFNICKMPRQTGKSTTVVAFLLHYAVFNNTANIAPGNVCAPEGGHVDPELGAAGARRDATNLSDVHVGTNIAAGNYCAAK